MDREIDSYELGPGDQKLGQFDQQVTLHGFNDRGTQINGDHYSLAGEVKGVEIRFPAAHARKAQGVARVEAVARIKPACGIAHRARDAADGHGERGLLGVGTSRNPSKRGLQSEESGEARGNPNGTTAVASRCDGEEATGDGGR